MSSSSSTLNRDIGTEDVKIEEFVGKLRQDKFLIPTFQREFVWEPKNIVKLWDSICRFYPIGSILYWETNSYLHTHRKLGGFLFPHDEDAVRKFRDWAYILDGQQRATALLLSMIGGKGRAKDREEFDYTLYFDATDASFFFEEDLESRKNRVNPAFLVRIKDVPSWGFTFYKDISTERGFNTNIEANLQKLSKMFTDYKISLIRIRGVEVSEVCEIFERINQEGKKLDPVDIIVARTYRNEDITKKLTGFYLRDNLDAVKKVLSSQGSQFQDIEDLTILQMVSLCLRKQTGESKFGMTPAALYNLTTEDLEANWDSCQKTVLETVKLLSDFKIRGPDMLPFIYLVLPICHYLHENRSVNRSIVRQWFWATAFGLEDFRRATDVYSYCTEFFDKLETQGSYAIDSITISKKRLVETEYYYRDAFCRAVLAFLANQTPRDFSDYNAEVLDSVYLLLAHSPNLHHIYPLNFLSGVKWSEPCHMDSLMNICYLRAKTNIHVGDKNPLHYFREYHGTSHFDEILQSHLIPKDFIEREQFVPSDYQEFLYARADRVCQKLKQELPDVKVNIAE